MSHVAYTTIADPNFNYLRERRKAISLSEGEHKLYSALSDLSETNIDELVERDSEGDLLRMFPEHEVKKGPLEPKLFEGEVDQACRFIIGESGEPEAICKVAAWNREIFVTDACAWKVGCNPYLLLGCLSDFSKELRRRYCFFEKWSDGWHMFEPGTDRFYELIDKVLGEIWMLGIF